MNSEREIHSDVSRVSSAVVDVLRDIQTLDPKAFDALVAWRTPANQYLVEKEEIPTSTTARNKSHLSLVGLLNAILLRAKAQKIATVVDNEKVVGFTIRESIPGNIISHPLPATAA